MMTKSNSILLKPEKKKPRDSFFAKFLDFIQFCALERRHLLGNFLNAILEENKRCEL